MEYSFTQWRSSSGEKLEEDSIVISDSDDDIIIHGSTGGHLFVEDSDEADVSENTSPKRQQLNNSTPIRITESEVKKRLMRYKIIDSDDDTNDYEIESDTDYQTVDGNESDSTDHSTKDADNDSPNSHLSNHNRGTKRKDITHDNTKEELKEFKYNESMESFDNVKSVISDDLYNQKDDYNSYKIPDTKDKTSEEASAVVLDSDSGSEKNSESELALSLAKEQIGVGNVDPLVAQKRALIICRLEHLQKQLAKTKLLLTAGNMEVLPDKGRKLHLSILEQEKEIEKLTLELENTPLMQNFNNKEYYMNEELQLPKKESLFLKDELNLKDEYSSYLDIDSIPMKPTTSPELRELGKKAQQTRDKELALTVDRLQDLHGSLMARPSEDEIMEDPKGLKVQLMPHQQHALKWLLWRETQKTAGGILADDMGLGKTLTMISLVISTLARKDSGDSDDSDSEWHNENQPLRHKGGTLVVCPASLLAQWENEIQNRCKRGLLSVQVHHGNNRESVPKRLARNDIVITTYNIASREYKTNSTLYKIHWKRVILDEAHVIRNHKSQLSEAACGLIASKRWALTGTPIQNKELDLYSILKFLKCSPFNDLRVWKRWVDNKNAAGHQRLATIMKTLMLRRTKQELQAKGNLESLPEKFIEEVIVQLDSQEQLVYEKILIYSRTLFAQFLSQRAEKEHMVDLYAGKYNKPTFLSNPNKDTKFTKAQNKLLAMHADVKAHEILVLLLRLRQVCCHPALINAMLDQEDMKETGITGEENVDLDLVSRVNNMSLHEFENENENLEDEDIGINRKIVGNLLTAKNPVFENNRTSSKMKALLNMVQEILQKTDDKLIIVSQWATLLNVIASQLSSIKDATYSKFTGSVAIKDRQGIMDSFNNRNSNPRILLLSLSAGGVGLNLVGGNHLLLFDIHWNPQLETQAQDRIYRFGQTKNVYIYKFICSNTIEERIKSLQEQKLDIAQNVLSGDRSNTGAKLTLNDLKSLFAL